MPVSETWKVVLARPKPDVPWGLRLHGGVDCNEPVTVYQVRRRGLADKAGLKVGDFVTAIEGISTNRLTHRQALDIIGTQRLSVSFTLSGQPPPATGPTVGSSHSASGALSYNNAASNLASRGLLAYLPINTTNVESADVVFPEYDGLADGFYKASYRAPPFRPTSAQQVKNYQPFDMTGKNSFYAPAAEPATYPARTRQLSPGYQYPFDDAVLLPYASPSAAAAVSSAISNADASHAPTALSATRRDMSTSADYSQPQAAAAGQTYSGPSYWSTRISYYNNDMQQQRSFPSQSKSFRVLEAVLSEQGSGEQGLPPPPHRSLMDEQKLSGEDQRVELLAIHEPGK